MDVNEKKQRNNLKNHWVEMSLWIEDQKISITPNETLDGLKLNTKEVNDDDSFITYLSFDEARALIQLLELQIRNYEN